eukprot:gb/GECG01001102.1/.p1 GENE.gb/GECG01001102.1/~~gb/GECG01001102.1/.p1  ORF type:complete len:450 (+),score=55.46 gb/GECG01001102.1/:1-1350(+)
MGLCSSKSVHNEFEEPSHDSTNSLTSGDGGRSSQKGSSYNLYRNSSPPRGAPEAYGEPNSFTSPLLHRNILRRDEYDAEDVPFVTHLKCTSMPQEQEETNSPAAFASWSEGTVSMHDVETKRLLGHFAASKKSVNKIAVSSAANIVATASRDATVGFWKWKQNDACDPVENQPNQVSVSEQEELAYSFEKLFHGEHGMTVSAADITDHGQKAVSGSRDTSLKIWDIAQQKVVSELKNKPRNIITCLQWFPSGNGSIQENEGESVLFAQGAEDLHVRIWDCRVHRPKEVLTLDGYVYFPLDMDISVDGTHIVTSSKGFDIGGCELKLWDIRFPERPVNEGNGDTNKSRSYKYTKQGSFHGHTKDAVACSFLSKPDTSLVCSASKDSTLRLWQGGTEGQCISTYTENGAAGFSSMDLLPASKDYGKLLASTFEGDIRLYGIDSERHFFREC